MGSDLTPEDLAQLAARGIAPAEAERQLRLLRAPASHRAVDRPCTPGDGIERIEPADEPRLAEAHAEAAAAGRLSGFVPASGAATRMFKDLLAHEDGAAPGEGVRTFLEGLPRFAFAGELARVLGEDPAAAAGRGEIGRVLRALLDDDGLGYAGLPKGLIRFHGERTAFEEHLVEGAEILRDAAARCRLHFTVSPEHEARFRALLGLARRALEPALDVVYDVGFSTQGPATDTLAVDLEGRPFRDEDGRLLLRPAGHGALLANLQALGGDLVLVKNIDNVAAAPWRAASLRWGRLLLGRLAELERGRADRSRPLRVCGMVPNTGEPGGGPFWVRGPAGPTRQIVESAEIDPSSAEQRAIFARATHFNPVFLACALRGPDGRPHELRRFVDEDAVIVTRKSSGGRDLLALERPGLWNGSMAGWDTVFVEVPIEVFNPVKTVNDLLRRQHQP
jgi:hypothetical protein